MSSTTTTRDASDRPIQGNDPALLRRINEVSVIRLLYGRPSPLPLSGIVRRTGLSRRTVEGVLAGLTQAGLVETGAETLPRSGAGRPARGYAFRGRAGSCLAVEVAASRVRAVVTDLTGTILTDVSDELDRYLGRDERLHAMIACARRALGHAGVHRRQLWSVAVSTPGVVHGDGAVTTSTTVPNWSDTDIAGPVGAWARAPVKVDNDVNAAARAEQWRGVAQDADTLLWVLVLTAGRAKASLILDRSLYRGWTGAAGEIGLLSRMTWTADVEERLRHLPTGHEPGAEQVEAMAARLTLPLAALVLIVNPPLLVLGGAPEDVAPGLADAVARRLEPLCHAVPRVVESTLGTDSVMLGTVRTALDEVERRLFAYA